jgi:hypothetical protein
MLSMTPIKLDTPITIKSQSKGSYNDQGIFVRGESTDYMTLGLVSLATKTNTSYMPTGVAILGVDYVVTLQHGEAYPERPDGLPADQLFFNGRLHNVIFADTRSEINYRTLLCRQLKN